MLRRKISIQVSLIFVVVIFRNPWFVFGGNPLSSPTPVLSGRTSKRGDLCCKKHTITAEDKVSVLHSTNISHLHSYKDWSDVLHAESECVDSQFITAEFFLGVLGSRMVVTTRWMKTCPNNRVLRLDIQSRHMEHILPEIRLEMFLSNPRFEEIRFRRSHKNLQRCYGSLKNILQFFLRRAEEKILKFALKQSKFPKRFNYKIPVLVGDSSFLGDHRASYHQLFYSLIRLAINGYKSKTGFIFFTTPRYAQHISIVRKLIGDYIGMSPSLLDSEDTRFLPFHLQSHKNREKSAMVFVGIDTSGFFMEVGDPSMFPQLTLGDLQKHALMSFGDRSHLFLAAPFMNLGFGRASAILIKTFCEEHVDKFGVCHFPCFRQGWTQPCHGGELLYNYERSQFLLADSVRPAYYCDSKRPEMEIHRQRHLCEHILGYNVSDPYPPSRTKIKNCGVITGTGDYEKCTQAFRKLMKTELPFTEEAVAAGFGTSDTVGNVLVEPLNRVTISTPYIMELLSLVDSVNATRTAHNDRVVTVELLDHIARNICNKPLSETTGSVRRAMTPSCLKVSFFVELLSSFGCTSTTTVHLLFPFQLLKGANHLGLESDPNYQLDLFLLGAGHHRAYAKYSERILNRKHL